ncbi:hypothetical protein [Epilithonimonas mollis]|uniref:Phage tail protein n=1 Tax=Epilithonimonas mollis TaxID=216903 RepID=A0A1M6UKT1_9FLAO|nr:hypothetical protein [Epilithonimonas mollis]SHK69718.1 hypothetical protein SAMN05444371_3353 [Epilithonimonas mollis]
MSDIIVNSKAYDSVDVKVFIEGVQLNVKSFTYGNEQDTQLNHTLGADATSWSEGKITPSASMTVPMVDIMPLEVAAKGQLMKLKPLTAIIEYVNEYNIVVIDRVIFKFKDEGRDVTGDMGLEKQYDLFALKVDLNIGARSL